jgi:hypothetical protein
MTRIIVFLIIILLVSCTSQSRKSNSFNKDSLYENLLNYSYLIDSNDQQNLASDTLPPIIKSLLRDIDELAIANRDIRKDSSIQRMHERKEMYPKLFLNLNSLLSQKDIMCEGLLMAVYNYSNYYDLDTISHFMILNDLLDESRLNRIKNLSIDTIDWRNFNGDVRITESGSVLSSRFEYYSTSLRT